MSINKTKKYELTLITHDDEGKFKQMDKVVSDDLVHLLAQFILVIATVTEKERDELRNLNTLPEDDIPF